MVKQPFGLIFLILVHLFAPLLTTAALSLFYSTSLLDLFQIFITYLTIQDFLFYIAMGPFISILLLRPRPSTFFIFIFLHLLFIFYDLGNFRDLYLGEKSSFLTIMLIGDLINLFLVFLILTEGVRSLFFDSSLRWWESAPRYPVVIECLVQELKTGNIINGKMLNISSGGALIIVASDSLTNGEKINLSFQLFHQKIKLEAVIRHCFQEKRDYMGVEFLYHSYAEKKSIKKFLYQLKEEGVQPVSERYGDTILSLFRLLKKEIKSQTKR